MGAQRGHWVCPGHTAVMAEPAKSLDPPWSCSRRLALQHRLMTALCSLHTSSASTDTRCAAVRVVPDYGVPGAAI